MEMTQLIREALDLRPSAIAYHVSQQLAAVYPDRSIVEGNDSAFNLHGYVQAQFCQAELNSIVHNELSTHWGGVDSPIFHTPINACFQVVWQNHSLDVLFMSWQGGFSGEQHYWILAETMTIAQAFFRSVCTWNSEIRDEVLVFENGCWGKNPELFQAIQGATLDNLVLAGTLKQEVQADLLNFFQAQSIYQGYGIPWKRGILLIGPPGNGKTHTVKALLNTLQKPCLYVKSFKSFHATESESIRRVFHQARRTAPCILVLEDLDSLLNRENRSFFLNELDGFAANEGIVTLATTNYPERLDPAILDRPSRFDRKYHFPLPATSERLAYIHLWNAKFKPAMRLSDAGATTVAAQTADFSFAYLKELFLSSTMAWAEQMQSGGMDQVMSLQAVKLRSQMESAPAESVESAAEFAPAEISSEETAMLMDIAAWAQKAHP